MESVVSTTANRRPTETMKFNFCYAILLVLIGVITLTRADPIGGWRVRRQNMEQLKPWMEWGSKYGQIMGTTVIMPAAQEAASIASAGREGGGEGGGEGQS
ncbi:uncharacterized protein LOC118509219 [Anopheles stephensi]|uniref:uncharacterized protein LOC118509219 n=1 Tax=Anopheles stephensi TaxID=30069 RepID=UPI0016589C56|nr:uncharacterized protein LOC118509219 [Anopheles stephensi]